jgi:glycosyltransferase involved in cell wall biosynthesis
MGFRYPGLPWLSACDVHAVTAVDEPFGRSLIEAMLIGTPVVAVASGGNSEAICDGVNGLLTPPDDAEAMAGRILELLGNPAEATAMAARACADARAGFGRERHARVIAGIYDELLTRRGESA